MLHLMDLLTTFNMQISTIMARQIIPTDGLDNLPLAYQQIDNKGEILYVNNAWSELTGFSFYESVGQSASGFLAKPFSDIFDKKFSEFISRGKLTDERITLVTKDGRDKPVNLTGNVVRDEKGDIRIIHCLFNDIEELQKAEFELKAKTDQIENFFDLAADMLTISDFNGHFLKLNKAWTTILGFTAEEITNKPFIEFVHPDDHEITLAAFSKILKGEPVQKFENRYLSKDGSYKWLNWHSVPYKNTLVFSAACDVTQRKNYELELETLAAERKAINEDKDKFISILAHDLRNPFNTLLGFSQILLEQRKEMEDSELESMIKLIHKASHQTYNLLEDLLMWYKNQANKLPYEPELFFFEDQCENVMASIHAHAESKDIRIQCNKDKGKHAIYADINMFKTIVLNLFTNAVKFTPDGGTIELSFKQAGEMAEISVKDNGKGMTEEQIANLWIQGKNAGLGMFLCKEFAERNGGSINVKSSPGVGSIFTFSLPTHGPDSHMSA